MQDGESRLPPWRAWMSRWQSGHVTYEMTGMCIAPAPFPNVPATPEADPTNHVAGRMRRKFGVELLTGQRKAVKLVKSLTKSVQLMTLHMMWRKEAALWCDITKGVDIEAANIVKTM